MRFFRPWKHRGSNAEAGLAGFQNQNPVAECGLSLVRRCFPFFTDAAPGIVRVRVILLDPWRLDIVVQERDQSGKYFWISSGKVLGLADVEYFTGNFDTAREILIAAIPADEAMNNKYGMAVKQMALAEVYLELGDLEAAEDIAAQGLENVRAPATMVTAAVVEIAAGDHDAAMEIAASLAEQLSAQSRAYAEMIMGLVMLESGEHMAAINQLTAAIENADLWLLRFHRGRAYLEAGFFVEALDEFTAARDRYGEASAVFLEDLPTYRYMSTLPYWIARAQAELGISHDARQNFTLFMSRRPVGGPLADDARQRMK